MAHESHQETIVCPHCGLIQDAEVLHLYPFDAYVHECECGWIITESEWEQWEGEQPAEIHD